MAQINPSELIRSIQILVLTNSVYYLHPSFGYYFEYYSAEPHGMVYKLIAYPATTLLEPHLTPALEEENDRFWADAEQIALKPLEQAVSPPRPGAAPNFMESLQKEIHLEKERNTTASLLGTYYSRALDYWGVALQKAGRLTNAAVFFTRAMDVNPDNIVAEVNLECNKNPAGRTSQLGPDLEIRRGQSFAGECRSWDCSHWRQRPL